MHYIQIENYSFKAAKEFVKYQKNNQRQFPKAGFNILKETRPCYASVLWMHAMPPAGQLNAMSRCAATKGKITNWSAYNGIEAMRFP